MKKVNWKVYGEALDALQAQFSAEDGIQIHSQVLAVIPAGGILPVPKKRIIFRADLLRINNRFGDRQKLSQSILVHTFAFDSKDRRAGRRV